MSQQSGILSRCIPKEKAWTIVGWRIPLLVIGLVLCVLAAQAVYVSPETSGPATAHADVPSLASNPELMVARRHATAVQASPWAAILDAIPAPQISDDFVAAANRAAELVKSEQATSARWSALGAHYAAMRSEAAAAASSARYNALAAFYGLGDAAGGSRSREVAANPELMVAHRYAMVEQGTWAGSWTRSLCRGLPNPTGPC